MSEILLITDDSTRAEIEEALKNLNAHAKRQPYVIAKLMCDRPTEWDKAHRHMDGPLDDWLAAGPNCRTCGRTKAACDAEPRHCCPVCDANGHG